jgi:hypothetical protein
MGDLSRDRRRLSEESQVYWLHAEVVTMAMLKAPTRLAERLTTEERFRRLAAEVMGTTTARPVLPL